MVIKFSCPGCNQKLENGPAHIIHLHPGNGYFCITNDTFWDQFKD